MFGLIEMCRNGEFIWQMNGRLAADVANDEKFVTARVKRVRKFRLGWQYSSKGRMYLSAGSR